MKNSILGFGKHLDKREQQAIFGGTDPPYFSNVPEITIDDPPHYPDCPNVWVQCDGDGADCRWPNWVNIHGRCMTYDGEDHGS